MCLGNSKIADVCVKENARADQRCLKKRLTLEHLRFVAFKNLFGKQVLTRSSIRVYKNVYKFVHTDIVTLPVRCLRGKMSFLIVISTRACAYLNNLYYFLLKFKPGTFCYEHSVLYTCVVWQLLLVTFVENLYVSIYFSDFRFCLNVRFYLYF